MGCCLSRTERQPSSTLTHDPEVFADSELSHVCADQQQENEETPALEDEIQYSPSSSGPTDEKEEMVVTTIRATSIILGLRRLPAGIYVAVHHSGFEWRTDNKRLFVNDDVVEWSGSIPIPSDPSATVQIEIYASFEFQPALGTGEQLRALSITVEQLLDNNAKGTPFSFLPKDGDVVSPCSSLSLSVQRRNAGHNDSSSFGILESFSSTTESGGELEEATNHGHSALLRYQMHGDMRDLEHSIEEFERAFGVCLMDHPCRAAAQVNLAMAKLISCLVADAVSSLVAPLGLLQDALGARPVGHIDRPSTLIHLASVYLARFEMFGDEAEEAEAEKLLLEAMDLSPAESYEARAAMFMLQMHAGPRVVPIQVDDLLSLEQDSNSSPIDEGRDILSTQLMERFERFGDLAALEQAIAILKELVGSVQTQDFQQLARLQILGAALWFQFGRVGELGDLDDAISIQKNTIELTPHYHPLKPAFLANLGLSLMTRFTRLGQLSNLEDAISMLRKAVDLTPNADPDKPAFLNTLAHSFVTRFSRLGRLSDLEDGILLQWQAIDLTPDSHSRKPSLLNNLAKFLLTRFSRLGELNVLEDAILILRDAVALVPDDHPDKPGFIHNIGYSLIYRFSHLGELSDLQGAISTMRHTVDHTPDGHPDKPGYLGNLSHCIRIRFERLGQLSDLEDSVSMLRDAVNLTPDGHPEKTSHLNNLSISFFTRFQRLGQLSDLREAISRQEEVIAITPDDHPDKHALLGNLGNSFINRFDRLEQLDDLDNAISRQRNAAHLIADGHPDKPVHLSNLGISLRVRFERLQRLSDLDDAISSQRKAVELTLDGHPSRPARLSNLGRSLLTRFESVKHLGNLEDAVAMLRDAIILSPRGHPDIPTHLKNLGDSFKSHFERFEESTKLEQEISLYSRAASFPIDRVHDRFGASQNWISCAHRIHHHSLLLAYSVALNLLPELAWIGLSLSDRYSQLTKAADLVREAAAAALDHGFPRIAVEWLEQGRSIVWGELFQLRSSFEQLSSGHPDHSRRLQELSAALDHVSATHEQSLFTHPEDDQRVMCRTTEVSQKVADNHRRLAIERDLLLKEIRRLPGFEGFLRHKEFSQLRASAHSGPVVILNAADTRCDALIVLADVDHVIHVPLPKFTAKRAIDLQTTMKGFARDAREGKRETQDAASWESILSPLWKCVVKPVLDALAISTPGDLTRIFWCPTGPFMFLPIHAAGFYDERYSEPGNKIVDFVISSYTPTLSILLPGPAVLHNGDLRLLLVPQPPSDGQGRLPGVLTELEYIRDVIKDAPSAQTTLVESRRGTVEEVLDLLKGVDWCHFACHGIQDDVESGLCLADGRRLRLRDVIALSRPRGGLAFLSACQTATGEKRLSDEAIHITAGMLFAGYGGVVGTMWSISDRLAPVVARDVYGHLFRNGTRPDYREAARGLHEAIKCVRERGTASFAEWVPFIHVGL